MKLYVKSDCEWLYPDEDLMGTVSYNNETIKINAIIGSSVGLQVLVTDVNDSVSITVESNDIPCEINFLRDVTVNFNTHADGRADKVYFKSPQELPEHLTRRAPFQVYDAYKPYEGELPQNNKIAFFINFDIDKSVKAGCYEKEIIINSGRFTQLIKFNINVYDVELSKDISFNLTNWMNVSNMAFFHNLEMYSDEHFEIMKKYAKAMKYMHQQYFSMSVNTIARKYSCGEYEFDFSLFKRIADIFFNNGLQIIEFGSVGTRKSIFQEELDALGIDGLVPDSEEGIKVLNKFFNEFYLFLKKNGWENRIVFHIADEPDEPLTAVKRRLEQYSAIHKIIRSYFPNAKIIEAVKTSIFKDYIDVLVPETDRYENLKREFEEAHSKGKELWAYVCCSPNGYYFQRFLDVPMISGRILCWEIDKHNMNGFLHWGLNAMEEIQHPFNQTNQYHTYGEGCCLPAGDSHIVYPDGKDLYYSMRMEMCKRGCEDVELLKMLKIKNKQQYDEIMAELPDGFSGLSDYESFLKLYEKMLKALSQ